MWPYSQSPRGFWSRKDGERHEYRKLQKYLSPRPGGRQEPDARRRPRLPGPVGARTAQVPLHPDPDAARLARQGRPRKERQDMSNAILYLITVLVWGSTWLGIEFQLGVVAPEVSVFCRYGLASLLLFSWCAARGLELRFGLRAHSRFLLLGLLLFCLNYILTYHAQQHITSALCAIAFSTMLWMNIANARIFFGVRSGSRVLIGSALGVAGILTLFLPQVSSITLSDATFYGATLAVLGAFVASLGNMVSQEAQKGG